MRRTGLPHPLGIVWLLPFAALVAPLVAMQWVQTRCDDPEAALRWRLPLRAGLYVLLFFTITLLGEDFGVPFIYFQF